MSESFILKTLLKWLDTRNESENIFNPTFNQELIHDLGICIITEQETQKLKADREVMIEALKYSESQFRYIYNISSTPDIGECAKYCAEKAQQALKSIGEAE
jgi:hypothetical protein